MQNFELLEKAPVSKAILKLSIPTVLSTMVTLLYNLTDTYFIGKLDDPVQLGAISLSFPVFMVIQAVGNIFGNGAPSYISRCLGAGRYDEVKNTSSVSVYVAVLATLVLTGIFFLFNDPILSVLGTSPDTIQPTREYLNIIVGFGFVLTLQIFLGAFLRAESKIKEAVIGVAIGTVINIVLDPVFILGLDQGVAGAAWATIIGNAMGAIYYLFVYLKGQVSTSISPRDFKPSRRIFGEVLKIGLPASAAQILMSLSNIMVNNLAVGYGDYVLTSYNVAGKLSNMIFMFLMGYVSGYMPFAGYNYGARNIKRMLSALKFTLITSMAICVVLLIPYIFLSGNFMYLFTKEDNIVETGIVILHAQAWSIPFMGIQLTIMSTFQATGEAVRALIVNIGRQSIFYIPLLFLFNYLWKLSGLIYSYVVADILTTVVAFLIAVPLLKKFRNQAKKQP